MLIALRLSTAIIAVLTMLILGCSSGDTTPTPEVPALRGRVALKDWNYPNNVPAYKEPCQGEGGYSDLRGGAQVIVRNESDEIVGTGALNPGSVDDIDEISGGWRSYSATCAFLFRVENLPVAKYYTVEVTRRGELTYSFDELTARRWYLELEIGGD